MQKDQANFALMSPEVAFAVRSWSGRATYLAGERVACDSSDGEVEEVAEELDGERDESSHCDEVSEEEVMCASFAQ